MKTLAARSGSGSRAVVSPRKETDMSYDYQMPPDPSAVNWDIRREGREWQDEAHSRHEMTPEKFEMCDGKLFWSDEQRLRTLGLLLENCGAEAAVRMGDPQVWRDAVAGLDDEDATLRYAVAVACRWRGSFDAAYDLAGIESFYETVTTKDFAERVDDATTDRTVLVEQARSRNASKETRRHDYVVSIVVAETVRRDGEQAVAVVRQEATHRRYVTTPDTGGAFRQVPPATEVERWHETWRKQHGRWRLQFREQVEAPFTVTDTGGADA